MMSFAALDTFGQNWTLFSCFLTIMGCYEQLSRKEDGRKEYETFAPTELPSIFLSAIFLSPFESALRHGANCHFNPNSLLRSSCATVRPSRTCRRASASDAMNRGSRSCRYHCRSSSSKGIRRATACPPRITSTSSRSASRIASSQAVLSVQVTVFIVGALNAVRAGHCVLSTVYSPPSRSLFGKPRSRVRGGACAMAANDGSGVPVSATRRRCLDWLHANDVQEVDIDQCLIESFLRPTRDAEHH